MKKLLKINSSDASLIIDGPAGLLNQLQGDAFMYEYIPCVGVELKNLDQAEVILDSSSSFNTFKLAFPNARIGCKDLAVRDIISLLELLLERKRQELSIDCLHSSSVIHKGKALVFFGGASGMGKTRMMMHLNMQPDTFAYSDEKTLLRLHKNTVVGGNKVALLSKKPLRETYGSEQVNIESDNSEYPIGLLVHAYVENGTECKYEFWESDKAEWHLYEELTRKIRAVSRRVKDGTWPVDGLDTLDIAVQRISRVRAWTQQNRVLYIRGNESAIADTLIELCKTEPVALNP